jgi:PAS domain S-box-containing protein
VQRLFAEMKRYMRFGEDDEDALRTLLPHARPHFDRVVDEFYERLSDHEGAREVFSGPDQIARLKLSLRDWLERLLAGPWDDDYLARRIRIGQVHVRVGLSQRYMFGAMNLIRTALQQIGRDAYQGDPSRRQATALALNRILDLELTIMLETYREAFVDKVQELERREKVALEGQLAISRARYDDVVERAQALVVTFDQQGRIHLFNRMCEQLTGIRRQEAAGRRFQEVLAASESAEGLRAVCAEVLAGQHAAAFEGVLPDRAHRVRWQFARLPGPEESILCGIGLDVTEEYTLADRTRRAERLAAMGTLAAGLAHEIRNPLNAAHLQLSLLQRRLIRENPDIASAVTAAGLVASELARLAALVEDFLSFARPQPLRLARGDLRQTADQIVALVAPEAEAVGVRVELLPGPAVDVQLDNERMKQVVHNLVRNGVEAVAKGGHVRVEVQSDQHGSWLRVHDDGPGLPSLDVPLFEPFYTTKPAGTGLGLAIAHRIVTDHGGTIEVESRPGRTVFAVRLPAAQPPAKPA